MYDRMVTRSTTRLVSISASPVTSEDAACRRAEAEEERDERAQRQPVGVAVLGRGAVTTYSVARDAEEDQVDNEGDKGYEGG